MSGFVHWLARHKEVMGQGFRSAAESLRPTFQAAHGRTVTAMAEIMQTGNVFLRFACDCGALSPAEQEDWRARFESAVKDCGEAQERDQAGADPVARFLELLPSVLTSGRAHFLGCRDGRLAYAQHWGWIAVGTCGEVQPAGHLIGWVDERDGYVYLDPAASFADAQTLARATGEELNLSPTSLWDRLEEMGFLLRGDSCHRQRKIPGRSDRGMAIRLSAFPRWAAVHAEMTERAPEAQA
jgi:hypothetical protein